MYDKYPYGIILCDDELRLDAKPEILSILLSKLEEWKSTENIRYISVDSIGKLKNNLSKDYFNVIIMDQHLKGKRREEQGSNFLKDVRMTYPSIINVLITQYPEEKNAVELFNDSIIDQFFPKGDTTKEEELLNHVKDIIDKIKNLIKLREKYEKEMLSYNILIKLKEIEHIKYNGIFGSKKIDFLKFNENIDKNYIQRTERIDNNLEKEENFFLLYSQSNAHINDIFKKSFEKCANRLFGNPKIFSSLFDFISDFENMIFKDYGFDSLTSKYRSHFIHQFQVFLLGVIIIDKFYNKFTHYIFKHNGTLTQIDKKKKIEKLWFVTAAMHDIGFCIQRFDSLMEKYFKKVLKMKFPPTSLNLERIIVEKDYIDYINELISNSFKNNRKKEILLHKMLLTKNHGFLSAFAIMIELKQNKINISDYKPALNAISIHDWDIWRDFNQFYDQKVEERFQKRLGIREKKYLENRVKNHKTFCNFEKRPLTFLLILCDNIQDWGRPSIEQEDNYKHSKEPELINIDGDKNSIEINILHRYNQNIENQKDEEDRIEEKNIFLKYLEKISEFSRVWKFLKVNDYEFKIKVNIGYMTIIEDKMKAVSVDFIFSRNREILFNDFDKLDNTNLKKIKQRYTTKNLKFLIQNVEKAIDELKNE